MPRTRTASGGTRTASRSSSTCSCSTKRSSRRRLTGITTTRTSMRSKSRRRRKYMNWARAPTRRRARPSRLKIKRLCAMTRIEPTQLTVAPRMTPLINWQTTSGPPRSLSHPSQSTTHRASASRGSSSAPTNLAPRSHRVKSSRRGPKNTACGRENSRTKIAIQRSPGNPACRISTCKSLPTRTR